MDRLVKLWGLPKSFKRFPGCQPISIERRHFPVLKNNHYVICDKTDGERFLLFIDNDACNLIDRKNEPTSIKIRPPKECYAGTILDGEVIVEQKKKIFLVFDVVAWAGNYVGDKDLPTRMSYIIKNQRKFIRSPKDDIRIRPKVFSHLKDALGFQKKFVPTLKYKTDGYILTPIFDPVQIGTHNTMFKWKPLVDNTIDFLIKESVWENKDDVWDMFIQEKGELVFLAHLQKEKLAQKWTKILTKGPAILECKLTKGEWKPARHRKDKTMPNSRLCFYRTLTNINENIQEDEIIHMMHKGS